MAKKGFKFLFDYNFLFIKLFFLLNVKLDKSEEYSNKYHFIDDIQIVYVLASAKNNASCCAQPMIWMNVEFKTKFLSVSLLTVCYNS